MAVRKLSSKNQIVIQNEARQAMDVKGGDELLVVVKDDLTLIMSKPKRYAKVLQGLAKGIYPTDYLKRERRSWQGHPYPTAPPNHANASGLTPASSSISWKVIHAMEPGMHPCLNS